MGGALIQSDRFLLAAVAHIGIDRACFVVMGVLLYRIARRPFT